MKANEKIETKICIVCQCESIYLDAHPYGAAWENRCYECGCNQSEDAWFAQLRQMPMDMVIALQCPFVVMGKRCIEMHSFTLGDILTHTPALAQFRCSLCNTYGTGFELALNNKETLRLFVHSLLTGVGELTGDSKQRGPKYKTESE